MAKVTFVYRNGESLGIEYLSAFLKKYGHQTYLVFDPGLFDTYYLMNKNLDYLFNFRRLTTERIIKSQPDLIAFSVVSDDYPWACGIAKQVKLLTNTPIIFGGIHPTSVPQEVIKESFIDYVCVGEGEYALVELVEAIKNDKPSNNIKNIWSKEDGRIISNCVREAISDLDSLPFMDKDLFLNEYRGFAENIYMTITSRGCPYHCSFCANSYLSKLYQGKGSYVRRRSVDNVIEELKLAKQKYKMKRVSIFDDLFTYNREWLRDFAHVYKKYIDMPYFCCVTPSTIDEEIVHLLEYSGCSVVNMGVQTLNENIRREILYRYDKNSQIAKAIALLRKNNIYVYSNIILGLPGQVENDLIEDAEFLSLYRPDINTIYWLRYYPATDIVDKALSMSYLKEEDIKIINSGKLYLPYTIGGNTYSKNFAKLGNMLLLVHLLPRPFLKFIIKHRLYRLFPVKNFNFIIVILTGLFRRVLFNKKMTFFYATPLEYLKFCLFYMNKKITIKLKGYEK